MCNKTILILLFECGSGNARALHPWLTGSALRLRPIHWDFHHPIYYWDNLRRATKFYSPMDMLFNYISGSILHVLARIKDHNEQLKRCQSDFHPHPPSPHDRGHEERAAIIATFDTVNNKLNTAVFADSSKASSLTLVWLTYRRRKGIK
jgi:hypothetical protein